MKQDIQVVKKGTKGNFFKGSKLKNQNKIIIGIKD
jgi:hypothetical protein